LVIVTHGALLTLVLKKIRNEPLAASPGMNIGNAEIIRLQIGEPCKKCHGDAYQTTPKNQDACVGALSHSLDSATPTAKGR
jgi:broad specificity phosphatase PhoE